MFDEDFKTIFPWYTYFHPLFLYFQKTESPLANVNITDTKIVSHWTGDYMIF